MSSDIAVMTDSTCGLPPHIVERENLIVVPCQVRIGEETYREGVDLTAEELFSRLYASEETPATSLPAGEDYAAAFEEVQRRGATQVLGVFVGSGFSGTFNGARLAAQEYPVEVELIDSGTTSLALGLLVLEAAQRIRDGGSLPETAATIRSMAERAELYALLDTLEYIRRGGRIGRVGELIATFLNIKPVLRIARNSADVVARNRSRKKGLAWLREAAQEAAPLRALAVIHIQAEAEAQQLAADLAPLVGDEKDVLVAPASAAVAVHGGPGAIGFGMLR